MAEEASLFRAAAAQCADERCAAHPHAPFASPQPPPLCAADGGFTADSIYRRLPLIITEVLASATFPPTLVSRLLALRAMIHEKGALPSTFSEPDWSEWAQPGAPFAFAPWWYVENAFYAAIRDCCLLEGVRDPFFALKAGSLNSAAAQYTTGIAPLAARILATASPAPSELISAALHRSLFSNRADLSLHTLAGGIAQGEGEDLFLADDTRAAVECLLRVGRAGSSIVVTTDNVGVELLADLVLCLCLLSLISRVELHVKDRPVFVSDAMEVDVEAHLVWLEAHDPPTGHALRAALAKGALGVHAEPFYVSPLPAWKAPADLLDRWRGAGAVIFKGDAMYRRLVGDLHWKHATPFADVVRLPTNVISLRTCKSGVVVGVAPDRQAAAVKAAGPEDWLVTGKYAVVSFAPSWG